jgi:hypothetical protein
MISKGKKLAVVYLAFAAAVVYGQQTTADVRGEVTDPSSAPVVGATVKLDRIGQGVSRTVSTAADGRFSFTFIPPGPYTITVSQAGFADAVRSNLQLASGQDVDLPIQLSLKQVSEQVEVSATSAALDTATAEERATMAATQVNELPVAHEDWTNLLQLDSGTKKPVSPTFAASNTAGSGVNINGLPAQGYIATVDGTNASLNPEFYSYGFYQGAALINTVNNDSIAEVSVEKGAVSATVGNAMSGGINIVTKSGTNEYHGSLYELAEQTMFDARNQFLTARPRTTFNEYGASLGGPIVKNKLFFFAGWEGADLSTSKSISGAVPSPYLISIAPPIYQHILSLFPTAAQPAASPTATTSQFIGVGKAVQTDSNGVYRADYYINQNNLLAVRYVRARPHYLVPNTLLPSNERVYDQSQAAPNISYTHIGGNWTENTRFAYNKLTSIREDQGWSSDLPGFGFAFSTGGAQNFVQHGSYTTLQESIAFVHGRQSIQFGGIYERTNAQRAQQITPSISYSTLAQFLANTPSSITLNPWMFPPGASGFGLIVNQIGAYAQDDVKLTKDLTLNIGLRYDIWTVPQAYNGQIYNRGLDPANPQLGYGFGPFRPAGSFVDPNHHNFQPRGGLAYNLFGKGTTVIRAGFGIMTTARPLISGPISAYVLSATLPTGAHVLANATGTSLNTSLVQQSGLNYPLPVNPNFYLSEIGQLQAQGILSSSLATLAMPPNGDNPYSIQYTFGIQQVLPAGLTLEVNYNGNRGLHEFISESQNLPNRVTGIAPSTAIGLPGFGAFTFWTPSDRSKYAALQTSLQKKLGHGLVFGGSFTWSKANCFDDCDLIATDPPQDVYNVKPDWGPASFDDRLRFVGNGIWTVPLAKWMHFTSTSRPARLLLDGWQLSGVFSAQTGLPVNITNSASSWPGSRPDAAGLPESQVYVSNYQSGLHQYLNPAAFIAIPISSLSGATIRDGNLGHNALRAPGLVNLDASIGKEFRLTERFRLRMRADTFNTLNHTNLTGLVTTSNTTGTFGQLTQATARTMQIGARLTF